jgi:hypothetical protein
MDFIILVSVAFGFGAAVPLLVDILRTLESIEKILKAKAYE